MKEKEKLADRWETKCKHLEDNLKEKEKDLDIERGIRLDLDPTTAVEQAEAKHKTEISRIRKMYDAETADKNKEIIGLKHDRAQGSGEKQILC